KMRAVEALGADRAINYHTEDFVRVVRELTDQRGVDVILDIVGRDYLERNLAALAPEGRLVVISVQSGSKGEVDLLQMMQRRLTATGSTLRSRTAAEKASIGSAVRREVWPLVESGTIKPVVHATFSLAQAA